jgi:hypothetical protein
VDESPVDIISRSVDVMEPGEEAVLTLSQPPNTGVVIRVTGEYGTLDEIFYLIEFLLNFFISSSECGEGETCIFRMSDKTNAHIENCTADNYNNYLCASLSDADLSVSFSKTGCTSPSDGILGMSDTTNAHVEKYIEEYPDAQYDYVVCLNSSLGTVKCTYGDNSCDNEYNCLASISNETNAHVGDCNEYSIKVCCKIQ